MNTLSRSEKFGIGAIALGAALNVPVWYTALSSGEQLNAAQSATTTAVRSALSTANTGAIREKRAKYNHAKLVETLAQFDQQNEDADSAGTNAIAPTPMTDFQISDLTNRFAGGDGEWWQIKNLCVKNTAWYCNVNSNGVPLPTINYDPNPSVLKMPAPPLQPIPRLVKKTPSEPAKANSNASTDSISNRLRQLQMDNMSDFLSSVSNGLEAITQSDADLLLMLLNDMASDQRYAADFLRNQNTDCSSFVQRVTKLSNRFSTQFNDDPDAGSPTPDNLSFQTWLFRMKDIGFSQSRNNYMTWEILPATLMYCENNSVYANTDEDYDNESDENSY